MSTCVSMNIMLQFMATFKHLPTVTTVMKFSVAVHIILMSLQVAGVAESYFTQWTPVWFVSRVHSHVSGLMYRLTKCHVTLRTFVWFLYTVNSAVSNMVIWLCESFATNSAFKQSPTNEFICVLLMPHCEWNTFHIKCTCIYSCEHSYVASNNA